MVQTEREVCHEIRPQPTMIPRQRAPKCGAHDLGSQLMIRSPLLALVLRRTARSITPLLWLLVVLGTSISSNLAWASAESSQAQAAAQLGPITGALNVPVSWQHRDTPVAVSEEEEEELALPAESAPAEAAAEAPAEAAAPDGAANAFVLICAILVIAMSIPGIALFYGGLVRAKNVLSVMEQSLVFFGLSYVIWLIVGYSLAFGSSSDMAAASGPLDYLHLIYGDLNKALLAGISLETLSGAISEYNFVIFQGAFCAIASCLIVGATVERIKFSALMIAMSLWVLFSYIPLCHMVWGVGLIEQLCAAYDFAGGTVVHINAAVAALVGAKLLGPRADLGKVALPPHALPLTFLGGGLLWIGWFGFNAGSALTPDGSSALAFANTVFGPVGGALAWSVGEYCLNGKVSSLGSVSGVLAGLVAITPACAFVGPVGAVIIGALAGLACLWGVRGFKRLTKIDDSLDVFGIHGIGAIVGALLTGIFCSPALGGTGFKGFHDSIASQFMGQLGSVVIAIVWSAVVSYLAFKIAALCCRGLRVELDDERMGLDLSYHGERSYTNL